MILPPPNDMDSRFLRLLTPVSDLENNFEVDIAKYLEEYIQHIVTVKVSFDGGTTSMNFAEAALLVQGSVSVYSRKVEFLWQIVLQVYNLLHKKNDARSSGDNRRRMTNQLNMPPDYRSHDDLPVGRNIDLKEDDDKRKSLNLLSTNYHQFVEEDQKSIRNVTLKIRGKESLGNKGDFRLNRRLSSVDGVLFDGLVGESVLNRSAEIPNDGAGTSRLLQETAAPIEEADEPGPFDENPAPEPPPQDNPPEEGEAVSPDDPPPDDCMGTDPPADDQLEELESCNEVQTRSANSAREKERIAPAAPSPSTTSVDPWEPIPFTEGIPERPIRKRKMLKIPRKLLITERKKKRSDQRGKGDPRSLQKYLLAQLLENSYSSKNPLRSVCEDFRHKAAIEQKCRKEMSRRGKLLADPLAAQEFEDLQRRLRMEFTGDFLGFEEFDSSDVEEDQGFRGFQDGVVEALPGAIQGQNIVDLPLPESPDNCDNFDSNTHHSDNEAENGRGYRTLYEDMLSEPVRAFLKHEEGCLESTDLAKRVARWHEIIGPKLEAVEKRGNFDIHDYGTSVLNAFPNDNRKSTISFHSVAESQESEEVCRYFLATLQLANTYNVEISKSDPSPLSMDCVDLTLLSSQRHHEALHEFEAPSEEQRKNIIENKRRRGKRKTMNDEDNREPVDNMVNGECDSGTDSNSEISVPVQRKRKSKTGDR